MIATPCHHGKVDNVYTLSLVDTCKALDKEKIDYELLLPTTGSILSKERNDIIEAFYRSDCTHLLTIDSDIGWKGRDVVTLLNHDKDIVCGVYPARTNTTLDNIYIFVPDANEEDDTIIVVDGLLKMKNVPAGFMLISRNAIETMREKLPELRYENKSKIANFDSGYAFYNTELVDGSYWGEDFIFCRNAEKAGINIWCDPTLVLNHAGRVGSFLDYLNTNMRREL